jgi:ABC-type antimicrobial peptide transport system permease subunit
MAMGGDFTRFIFLAFSLVILVSVSTLVANSRRKEFGTFIAMGFRWFDIYRMMLMEYLIIAFSAIIFSIALLKFIIYSFLSSPGLYISSKDLQAALLAEYIPPTLTGKDIIFIILTFGLVISSSLAVTILKTKKTNPLALINN